MFDIISIGRSDLLIAVLNGVAILTSSTGPAGYGGLIALGLMIGILLTLGRAIVTQKLELQWILVGWLLYAVIFLPKVTVTVEDVYTGTTTTVANVPIGIGAIGGVTSTIGVTLTDSFGTVFAFPSLTSSGYMDSLDVIHSMREIDYGDANDGSSTTAIRTIDVQRSLRSYLIDCVFYDMLMDLPAHDITWEELRTANNLLDALEVNSSAWFTTIYLVAADEDGQTVTCTNAYQNLRAFMLNNFYPAWLDYIASILGVADAEVTVQDSIDALFGVGKSAQTFMLNALISREIRFAELGYHASVNNTAGVVMRTQAMEQRRTQWATEQSMFIEVARPLISYIESFFYAVSPFMAFLFTLGAVGITLFGRYLMLAIWIQLWMPVMAINNLYINLASSEKLQDIDASGLDVLSMVGMENVWTETSSWLAVGGMLAAATPLLTLMIITGSYYAFTRLTDRMAGDDYINEKISTPDISAPAPIASMGALGAQQALFSNAPVTGTITTGAGDVIPDIQIGSALSRGMQSALNSQQQAISDWAAAKGAGLNLQRQDDFSKFTENFNSSGTRSSHTMVDSVMERATQEAVKGTSLENTMTSDERAVLHGALGAAMQGRGMPVNGQVSQMLQNIRSLSETEREQISDRLVQAANSETGIRNELAEAIETNEREGLMSRYSRALGVSDSQEWREAQRDVVSASKSFNEISALRQQVGLDFRVDGAEFGHRAVGDGSVHELEKMAIVHGMDIGKIEDVKGMFVQTGLIPDADQAKAASIGIAMSSSDNPEALNALAAYMAPRYGTPATDLDDAASNKSLSDEARTFGEAQSETQDQIIGVSDDSWPTRFNIDQEFANTTALNREGRGAVQDFFQAHKQSNDQEMNAAIGKIETLAAQAEAEKIQDNFSEVRNPSNVIMDTDASGWVADNFQETGKALGYGAASYDMAYEKAREEGKNPIAARLTATAAALRGYQEGIGENITETHEQAYSTANEHGLPSQSAEYFAQKSVGNTSTYLYVMQNWGMDDSFDRLRDNVEQEIGYEGRVLLDRAASAEPVVQDRLLDQVSSLYKAR